MKLSIGIIGAGICGRTLALELNALGHIVTLFDRGDSLENPGGASFSAGGMLSPIAELESAEPEIFTLGLRSFQLWQNHIKKHNLNVDIHQRGAAILAHPQDKQLITEFVTKIKHKLAALNQCHLFSQYVNEDIPLSVENPGVFIESEGHFNPRDLMREQAKCIHGSDIDVKLSHAVGNILPFSLDCHTGRYTFDWVIDCRGLGASVDNPNLRPVKGEAIILSCPEIHFDHPIRLLHPRHPVYLIPREDGLFYLGATSLESGQPGITVLSIMELLSVVTTLNRKFYQATVKEIIDNFRPALPDHLPAIQQQAGLIEINGLYRHGFLITPSIVENLIESITNHHNLGLKKQGESYEYNTQWRT